MRSLNCVKRLSSTRNIIYMLFWGCIARELLLHVRILRFRGVEIKKSGRIRHVISFPLHTDYGHVFVVPLRGPDAPVSALILVGEDSYINLTKSKPTDAPIQRSAGPAW